MPVDLSKSVSNPYANQKYRESPWQFFLSNLGFRTQADAWRENMAVQAAEFDSALQQKAADMEYNDPVHQLERMRAAGLNPDIDGGSSISSGEAPAMPQDPSTPMQSTGWDGTIQTLGTSILGAFSSALGIVQSIQGIGLRNMTNRLDIAKTANDVFPSLIPAIGESVGNDEFNFDSLINDSVEMAKMYSRNNLPKRFRRQFVNTIEGFWASAPKTAEAYKEWSDRVSAKRDYAVNSQTLFDEFSDILYPMAKEIADMNEQLFRQSQKTELAEGEAAEAGAQTEKAYQEELSGSEMGAAQNAANRSAAASSTSSAIVSEHIKNIMTHLEGFAKEGGMKGALSSIALSIISGIYLYVQSGIHPSISRSEGSNSGYFESDRGHGANQGSKRSFSIGF